MNYYNDNNPHAAAWLDNLRAAGEIPNGWVDNRSIRDVASRDVRGFVQAHWFAGIGGWALALRLAGWHPERPVWTASCPCQPFSGAGKRLGTADDRHLWPVLAERVGKCKPPIFFGEQVASSDGRDWLAGVRLDLEDMGYAVGAADLCAAGVGAPHIRQRLFFGAVRLGNADGYGLPTGHEASAAVGHGRPAQSDGSAGGLADTDRLGLQRAGKPGAVESAAGLSESKRDQRQRGGRPVRRGGARSGGVGVRCDDVSQLSAAQRASPWADAEWLDCKDGKSRRVKPGVSLLADGLPREVAGPLAGFGNAIVPQVAATFILSFMETVDQWQR